MSFAGLVVSEGHVHNLSIVWGPEEKVPGSPVHFWQSKPNDLVPPTPLLAYDACFTRSLEGQPVVNLDLPSGSARSNRERSSHGRHG